MMINKGKIISKAMVGYNKNPGIPYPSIQLIVPSILKILLYPTIALEIILPLFIILGYKARISASLLAAFCIATAFIFHFDFNDQMQLIAFLKNFGLAGGFLFIVCNGTKEWAIEREKKYVRL